MFCFSFEVHFLSKGGRILLLLYVNGCVFLEKHCEFVHVGPVVCEMSAAAVSEY